MNRPRERLFISTIAGACYAVSRLDLYETVVAQVAHILGAIGFVVFAVYALELAIANGTQRAKNGPR